MARGSHSSPVASSLSGQTGSIGSGSRLPTTTTRGAGRETAAISRSLGKSKTRTQATLTTISTLSARPAVKSPALSHRKRVSPGRMVYQESVDRNRPLHRCVRRTRPPRSRYRRLQGARIRTHSASAPLVAGRKPPPLRDPGRGRERVPSPRHSDRDRRHSCACDRPLHRGLHLVPDGRRVAFISPAGLWVVGSDGSGRKLLARSFGRSLSRPSWSPDGAEIAFENGDAVRVVGATGHKLRTLASRGRSRLAAWVRGPVPLAATRVAALPPIEVASRLVFRSRGRIKEMVVAGGRAATLVAASHLDCVHVAVWSPWAKAVAREGPPIPCEREALGLETPTLGGLRISGRIVRWSDEWACGNTECYHDDFRGIVVSPTRIRVTGSFVSVERGGGGPEPKLPCVVCPLPNPTASHTDRVGMLSMYVRHREVHLSRRGQALRVLRLPGRGRVFARLRISGLFYAYNMPRAAEPGRVRFVRLRALLP